MAASSPGMRGHLIEGLLRCEQEAGALGEAAYTHASQCEDFLEEVVRNASRWWRDGPREEAWTHQPWAVCGARAARPRLLSRPPASAPTVPLASQPWAHSVCGSLSWGHGPCVLPARPTPNGPDPRRVSKRDAKPMPRRGPSGFCLPLPNAGDALG